MNASDHEIVLEGGVESIHYESDDREFQVIVLRHDGERRTTVVVRGAGLLQDEHIRVRGVERRRNTGELQLEATGIDRLLPSTKEGLVRFLASNLVKGIGASFAQKIVDQFGDETVTVLNEFPERLREVPGIGPGRSKAIVEAWREHEAVRGIMVFLQSHGISPAFANRIYRYYGDMSVSIVKTNPYRLARDIRGIGFFAADKIAQQAGIGEEDPRRVAAALEHALHEARIEGHVYLPQETAVERTKSLLRRDDLPVEAAIEDLLNQGVLVRDPGGRGPGDSLYIRARFEEEQETANLIHELLQAKTSIAPIGEAALRRIRKVFPFPLSEEQERALSTISRQPIAVLTGGPGTGKTTIVKALVTHAEREKATIMLTAPTGRAAWRLTESTGKAAATIHRLLEFDPRERGFLRDRISPLEADLIIVDESSMLDQNLGRSLLRAVGPGTQLIFVGDADQLPPVGAGEVFADLIRSGAVTTANLNRVFRQGDASSIVVAAHEVREGRLPRIQQQPDGEYFFIRRDDPKEALKTIVEVVTKRMPKAFGLDPLKDIQILAPTHRGDLGNQSINAAIQKELSGHGPHITVRGHALYLGEKVMQTRNNYDLEVFNGDIGVIEEIDPRDASVTVAFETRSVKYGKDDLDDLELAWSISVHKSQGSEFPAVVLALATHHFKLLQRNLVYTGMTCAKQRLIIVGSERAFRMAVDHISGVERLTRLDERIARLEGGSFIDGES